MEFTYVLYRHEDHYFIVRFPFGSAVPIPEKHECLTHPPDPKDKTEGKGQTPAYGTFVNASVAK
jgi:hypothetical protein